MCVRFVLFSICEIFNLVTKVFLANLLGKELNNRKVDFFFLAFQIKCMIFQWKTDFFNVTSKVFQLQRTFLLQVELNVYFNKAVDCQNFVLKTICVWADTQLFILFCVKT